MQKVALLSEKRYLKADESSWYLENIILEDKLLTRSLYKNDIIAKRVAWDDNPDLSNFDSAIFRTTWNYFNYLDEFIKFLTTWKNKLIFINPIDLVLWSLDKKYLFDLNSKGINIPESVLVKRGQVKKLKNISQKENWSKFIIKPCISAAAWETYCVERKNIDKYESLFYRLVMKHDMLVQNFQDSILSFGEISFMLFDGKYSHAVIKKPKKNDSRVQDDFGGTVSNYYANNKEINFAERVVKTLKITPAYARVDVIVDKNEQLALSELELIEPELWFRKKKSSSDLLAGAIKKKIKFNRL